MWYEPRAWSSADASAVAATPPGSFLADASSETRPAQSQFGNKPRALGQSGGGKTFSTGPVFVDVDSGVTDSEATAARAVV